MAWPSVREVDWRHSWGFGWWVSGRVDIPERDRHPSRVSDEVLEEFMVGMERDRDFWRTDEVERRQR
jgi:hypothetical protein